MYAKDTVYGVVKMKTMVSGMLAVLGRGKTGSQLLEQESWTHDVETHSIQHQTAQTRHNNDLRSIVDE